MFKVLGLVYLITLLSCGQDSGSGKQDTRPPQHDGSGASTGFDLQGLGSSTWLSSCQVSPDSKTSALIGFQLEDTRMARSAKFFDQDSCADSEIYAIKVSTYNEIRVSDTNEITGGKLIKTFFGTMTLSPEQDSYAATLNKTAAYGFNDWATNVSKDVTGLAYNSESKPEWNAGKAIELIYKIEGNKLFFANFDSNDAPYFDEKMAFIKQ